MILANRHALVTGGARGIGRAISLTMSREGAAVTIADIDESAAKAAAEEIANNGGRVQAFQMDVSDAKRAAEVFVLAKENQGPVDILVNNAGITNNIATVIKMSPENWDREIKINLSGAFYCARQALPDMVRKKWGRIINISSGAGTMGGFGQCSYSSSKAGLLGFTKVVALEHARDNITSNAMVLGLVKTDAYATIREDLRNRIEKLIPVRRPGDPAEIGEVAAFLASDGASYINGAEINVTAGQELFVF